jgi:hypothetical protein
VWLGKKAVLQRQVSQGTLPFSEIEITEGVAGTESTTITPNMTASTSSVDALKFSRTSMQAY